MATYKLIQDIEAEDKILGPLTLRQFIFALIAVFLFYLCFVVVVKHFFVGFLVILLPPALFCGFFALPFGRDQPTEIWALAKLRFWFKPRKRVWNQSGIKELVTITVPKKVERVLTNGLSQNEVNSRLQVLAHTLDSRGWAVKHAEAETYTMPMTVGSSDRLIGLDNLPQEVPAGEAAPANDILDATTSPIARQFDNMITQSSQNRRQALMDQLSGARQAQVAIPAQAGNQGDSPWFMSQASAAMPPPPPVAAAPGVAAAPDDSTLAASLASRSNARQGSLGNLRTVRPGRPAPAAASQVAAMTTPGDPAILSLARNDDLNVATLARQANKNKARSAPDEVVISLH